MSGPCREMTNIEIANQIYKDLIEADAHGAGAWKIKIISALKVKDGEIFRLKAHVAELEDKCRKYEARLEL